MSRITKTLSEQIANKLIEPKLKEAKKLQQELSNKIIKYHQDLIPQEIKDLANKHKSYFKWGNYIYSNFLNNHYYSYTSDASNSLLISNGSSLEFKNEKDKSFFQKLSLESEKRFDVIEKLKEEIIISLQTLRTYTNIQKSFPEAAEYLPISGASTALVVNYDKLRAKLK